MMTWLNSADAFDTNHVSPWQWVAWLFIRIVSFLIHIYFCSWFLKNKRTWQNVGDRIQCITFLFCSAVFSLGFAIICALTRFVAPQNTQQTAGHLSICTYRFVLKWFLPYFVGRTLFSLVHSRRIYAVSNWALKINTKEKYHLTFVVFLTQNAKYYSLFVKINLHYLCIALYTWNVFDIWCVSFIHRLHMTKQLIKFPRHIRKM